MVLRPITPGTLIWPYDISDDDKNRKKMYKLTFFVLHSLNIDNIIISNRGG